MTDMYFTSHMIFWIEMVLSFIVVMGIGALINSRRMRSYERVAMLQRVNAQDAGEEKF